MLLAIEIDNSHINFGFFELDESNTLVNSFKISADTAKTSDEYAVSINGMLSFYGIERTDVTGAIVSSVVPQLTNTLLTAIKSLLEIDALTVGKGIKTGFPIKTENPSDLGADLVANAAAVTDIKIRENTSKLPCIIIDMGTATTVFAINANGEYIGGSILPGVGLSLDVLHGRTAQLPTVTLTLPSRYIGRNSQESIRSGVMLGNAIALDGFIEAFSKEMRCGKDVEVFITGEYSEPFVGLCKHKMRRIPELTLIGLCCIYKNNVKA